MKNIFHEALVRAGWVGGLAAGFLLCPPSLNAAVPSLAAEFSEAAASAASAASGRRWMTMPRVFGHLTAKDLGVVINTDDPYSVQIGEYYAKARGIPASRVLRLSLPMKATLAPDEFEDFKKQIDDFFGAKVEALALTWRLPFGVNCNSITGALAMGYDAKLCSNTCAAPSKASTYFGSSSTKPFKDHRMRLSMLLAAKDADSAKALIDRGVRSDGTLGLRGAPAVNAHFVTTTDKIRSVRQQLFPPAGSNPPFGVDVHLDQTDALKNADRVLLYQTGLTQVDFLDTNEFVPGALGDHLTSFGGILDKPHGQMTVLSWIDAGVTASYGTTSEPCAHLQKFPHPQALIGFYLQGATALEAYWKSVAWPQQGLFVGEPLASPFGR
ncbi:MAG: TIGR03790 family protein [Aquabacterium sp.]|uniref:TIGR03790 family protein n=1 Tax=Aquabacterium sp. TaxID=1872578 RepID=UPI002718B9CC|nr:TIGR03790 family protein [Aquabacterium sp.]MDO9002722.1 TIGR03790 family protein [Aquabacterium sp.]